MLKGVDNAPIIVYNKDGQIWTILFINTSAADPPDLLDGLKNDMTA